MTNYAFRVNENTKEIDCSMNRHPCKRDVCECDKQFAVNVAKYEHEWKEEYHIKRAGFDRYSSCRPSKERIILHLSFAIYVRTKKKSFQS